MSGHYHADFGDCNTINDPDWVEFVKKVEARKEPVVRFGFVCTFGCGRLHTLSMEEMRVLLNVENNKNS